MSTRRPGRAIVPTASRKRDPHELIPVLSGIKTSPLFVAATIALGTVAGCAGTEAPPAAPSVPVQHVAYVKASNPDAGDRFASGGSLPGDIGNAVAISEDGNTMAVGAPHESSAARGINGNAADNSMYDAGAVYVYVKRGDTWAQQAYVKASNTGQGDLFGMNIALSADGNTMVVAAPFESSAATGINGNQNDDSIPQAGAVYVFTRSGDAWTQQAYVKASNTGRPAGKGEETGDGDQFGTSVTLSADGNTMAVGAPTEDSKATGIGGDQADDSAASAGAVYLFTRAGTNWTQQAYMKGANTEAGDLFGYTVDISNDGNTLVIAGYDEDGPGRGVNVDPGNGAGGSGALYVFSRDGATWRQDAYLKGSRSEGNDALGYSVAISSDGNTIVGGAADESCLTPGINPEGCTTDKPEDASGGSSGAVYVWVRNGGTWTEQAFIKPSNPQLQDLFGVRLALSGDGNTILVGSPMEDSNGRGINPSSQADNSATESGAAYLFRRSGTTWTQLAYIKAGNADAFDEFGSSVAASGDGRTLVVGARTEGGGAAGVNGDQNDNSAPEAGALYVLALNP
ncbi:MAG: integrin [Vicinamibacterales bacterium]